MKTMNQMMAALMLASIPAMAQEQQQPCPVYPTPQHYEVGVNMVDATDVKVQKRDDSCKGGLWDRIPAGVSGAYAIDITPQGAVTVLANDETGVFYAKQTLTQMLHQVPGARGAQKDPFPTLDIEKVARLGKLPVGCVVDWPDLKYRGVVEGYYGIPWGYEARMSQFDFYGRNKMNIYIYAPKDDPLHHGEGCYQPYPPAKAHEIAAQVLKARENHVRFVWAIHPADSIKWEENEGKTQLDGLCTKLKWMYDLGVRDFAVLVDDSFGEIGKASRQVQLCNYIMENFIKKHPDVNQELIMCPTGYNKSWADEKELQTLGEGLHPNIHIMWTGNTVVNDITLEGQQWVNNLTKRPTFIWWNWPCNDMKPSRLSMGRTYGLGQEPEMKTQMSGFVANPMERAEAGKVGLYGVASYTWNTEDFDSTTTWKEGISRLYPQCSQSMQVFCDHNSDLLPNNHGYAREESVHVLDMCNNFRASIVNGNLDHDLTIRMQSEFGRIGNAGASLEKARGMRLLQEEIAPWLRCFTLTGEAGVEVIRAIRSESLHERIHYALNVVESLQEIRGLSRDAWQEDKVVQTHDVQTGSKAIAPALRTAFDYINASIITELEGKPISTKLPKFSTNTGEPGTRAANIADGNGATSWLAPRPQQVGDWYCLDLGAPTEINTISIAFAGNQKYRYYPVIGQMEYSPDGNTWRPIDDPKFGSNINIDCRKAPITAHKVRYRVVEPNAELPTCITEFAVNRLLPARIATTMQGMNGIYAYSDDTCIAFGRKMEVSKAVPGSYLEMKFPIPVTGTACLVFLENKEIESWCKIEFELEDGTTFTPKTELFYETHLYVHKEDMPKQGITAARIINTSAETHEIRLEEFKLYIPYVAPETNVHSLTDGDISTSYSCNTKALHHEIPVPAGATKVAIIATADCTVKGATPALQQEGLHLFTLEDGAKTITIDAPVQSGRKVYEVIFQ